MTDASYWRKCGSCKKEIGFNTIYQVCNVSSCRKLVYCSVDCWNLHNPVMNHKSSWAEENRSPRKEDHRPEGDINAPRRVLVTNKTQEVSAGHGEASVDDILIVASKLKQYVKDKYDMNTSANVLEALSHIVRRQTDKAVSKAKGEGRKTLMDRDFE